MKGQCRGDTLRISLAARNANEKEINSKVGRAELDPRLAINRKEEKREKEQLSLGRRMVSRRSGWPRGSAGVGD